MLVCYKICLDEGGSTLTKTITVTNQKGGTGKTSTSLFIAYGLAQRGYKVLLVDLDAQSDASYSTGASYDDNQTSFEMLLKDIKAKDAIISIDVDDFEGSLDLLPASPNLATLDMQIAKRQLIDTQYNLLDALKPVKNGYDYIILDTPPALSIAVLNALTASDYVVVPTQADIYSLKGLGQLARTIQTIQGRSNPSVKVAGILIGRYDTRTNFTKAITDMLEQTSEKLNSKVFATKIREAIAIKEAQGERTNLFEYAPKAKVTTDVNQFINELLGEMI